jgi:Oxidoreductase molybdopterin binding domain
MSDQEEKPIEDLKPDSAEGGEAQSPMDEIAVESAATADVPALADERVEDPLDDGSARFAEAQRVADEAVLAESRRHTRRAFVLGAAGAAAGYGAYRSIGSSPRAEMQPFPFRRAFEANAGIARGLTGDRALAPTYSLKEARDLRVNGVYGLKRMLAPASWRLQLVGAQAGATHPRFARDVTAWEYRYSEADAHEDQGHDTKVDPNAKTAEKMAPAEMMDQAKLQEERAERMPRGREEAGESRSTLMPGTLGLLLTMDDVLALPRHELVTQFKCIEGWSQIVHWAGVRMADFMEAYPPQAIDGAEPKYVYMETPDGDYYTGYDLAVCRHPQTLLVTEMMGAPLTQYHGAPLRLHMPTKYGYKQIKRIGLIAYTNDKPDDYWTKLGYDWYAGL